MSLNHIEGANATRKILSSLIVSPLVRLPYLQALASFCRYIPAEIGKSDKATTRAISATEFNQATGGFGLGIEEAEPDATNKTTPFPMKRSAMTPHRI